MGMSHDLEAAIAEGATMVRVGTAIFGREETTHENHFPGRRQHGQRPDRRLAQQGLSGQPILRSSKLAPSSRARLAQTLRRTLLRRAGMPPPSIATLLLLAVKPQQMREACAPLLHYLRAATA